MANASVTNRIGRQRTNHQPGATACFVTDELRMSRRSEGAAQM
jgi:hypothetical protein